MRWNREWSVIVSATKLSSSSVREKERMEFVVTKPSRFPCAHICSRSPFLHKPSSPQLSKLHLSPISFSSIKLKSPHLDNHIFAVPLSTNPNSKPRFISNQCSNSSNALTADEKSWIEGVGEAISTAFPVWVGVGCLLGLMRPSSYSWVQPKWTVMGITLTMLGMGMTLTFEDLRAALAMPKELLAGFLLQYSVTSLSLSQSNFFIIGPTIKWVRAPVVEPIDCTDSFILK